MIAELNHIADRVESLPRLPDTSLRLIRVAQDPDSSMREIVDTIRYDAVVTADVLRRCNSAFYGLERLVTSIDHAARLLGAAQLMQIAMVSHARDLLSTAQAGYGIEPGGLWKSSVAAAVGASLLGQRLRIAERGLLFTAGLLRDVGKLILNDFVGAEYATIARRVATERVSFCEAERSVLGYTHAELGGLVSERWGLPEPIVRCVRYHHEPASLPEPDRLVDVVHLADAICTLVGVGGGDDGQMYRADAGAVERSSLQRQDFDSLGATILTELKAIQGVFGGD